jgi:hypothetical protein
MVRAGGSGEREDCTRERKRDDGEGEDPPDAGDHEQRTGRVSAVDVERIEEAREIQLGKRDRDRAGGAERRERTGGDAVRGEGLAVVAERHAASVLGRVQRRQTADETLATG